MNTLKKEIEEILLELNSYGYMQGRIGKSLPNGRVRAKEELLHLFEKYGEEIIGEDLRHITDTKEIEEIVRIKEGNVSFEEIAEELQNDINAQNQLRSQQRQRLSKLVKGE